METTDHYLETQVLTAPPEQLHLMVIDGAIRFAKVGVEALEDKNYEFSHEAFSRSREFVNELLVGLNPEENKEIVDNLKGLFLFAHRCLTEADGNHNVKEARDAIQILEMHRGTWVTLMEKLKTEQAEALPPDHLNLQQQLDMSTEHDESTRSWLT